MKPRGALDAFDAALKTLAQRAATEDGFASELYAALCNMQWRHPQQSELVSMSWRCAGGEVADLAGRGEDYLDYYCSGNEGTVSRRVGEAMAALGWTPVPWPD
ncbi:MAG TPA: hypothetical protein VGL57_04525 [Solirubrobacteraceae bacterium]|jgi:hypothetical protein